MRALIAFDKFKDSLSARQACDTALKALGERHPDWSVDTCPLADGGEGFSSILTAAAHGQMLTVPVAGPRGQPLTAGFGLVPLQRIPALARSLLNLPAGAGGLVAVIEMAAASGLAVLPDIQRDPWQTTTRGTGELIRAATGHGVAAILVGVGGSATNDLGLGALHALGFSFLDVNGQKIDEPVPAHWPRIMRITGSILHPLPPIRIACDVNNPLLGPNGATAVFGPQKGLRPEELFRMEHECARLGLMLCGHCHQSDSLMDMPGGGAAGGIAFGLMAAARAQLLPGIDLVSAWLDLEARIAAADLVITGEGRFDDSSLQGKGPGAVAARALALGKAVHVFAGQVAVDQPVHGLALHAITPPDLPLAKALQSAPDLLAASIRQHC